MVAPSHFRSRKGGEVLLVLTAIVSGVFVISSIANFVTLNQGRPGQGHGPPAYTVSSLRGFSLKPDNGEERVLEAAEALSQVR